MGWNLRNSVPEMQCGMHLRFFVVCGWVKGGEKDSWCSHICKFNERNKIKILLRSLAHNKLLG